jgi:hypothetical protein
MFDDKDIKDAKLFLAVENNFDNAIKYINESKEYIEFFVPLFKKEKLSLIISEEDSKISSYIIENWKINPIFKSVIESVLTAGTNPKVIKKIRSFFYEDESVWKNQKASNSSERERIFK